MTTSMAMAHTATASANVECMQKIFTFKVGHSSAAQ